MSKKQSPPRTRTQAKGEHRHPDPALFLPANPGKNLLTDAEWEKLARTVGLTSREVSVATLMLEGLTRKAIARKLDLSVDTIRFYLNRLGNKLSAHGKLGLGLRLARLHQGLGAPGPWARLAVEGAIFPQTSRPT